ncbi:MAG: TonB-dependent receptor [Bacteroidales bacterium]|nr:TonB-dependent receptor [Bacteroidales bacterium]
MKKIIPLIVFILLTIQFLNAQNKFSGTVVDNENNPIFYATIVLFNQADSTMAKSTSSGETGEFVLEKIKDGEYYLEVIFTGYKKETKSDLIFPKDNNTKIEIKLQNNDHEIENVVVNAKKPLLEQQSDRLVVNVADNITGDNNNLMDVMKKVPGIIVIGDNISLAGATNFTILIDGKTTKYMDIASLLRDMPGDNILRVEIIHQPGAEFDAAGTGPIINIILKKNSLFGTFGSIKMSAGKGTYWRLMPSVSINHYQGNLNINGNFGFRQAGYKNQMIINRYVNDDFYEQISDTKYFGQRYRGNLNLDWNISPKHKVGFQSSYVEYNGKDEIDNITAINFFADTIQDQLINTANRNDGFWRLGSINPYYVFEIDTTGHKIEADFNYIQFGSNSETVLTPFEEISNLDFPRQRTLQPGINRIIVGKIDYTYPFKKYFKLQFGAKYSYADLDNDFISEYEDNNEWINNIYQSNHYLFDETILAGYSKLSFNNPKWSVTLGLRYEDSRSNGRSVGIDTVLTRPIKQFFPSASFSREIIKGLNAIFAYSYRLDRPRYSSLNPFRYSLDLYTFEVGNPQLRPEFTHSMKFTLAYQNQPFFNVEYKNSKDAIMQVVGQNNETGEGYRTDVNLDKKNIFNASLFFPLDFIPKISGYGGVIANYQQFEAPFLDQVYNVAKWDFTSFLQVSFTLPWKINTELSGYYVSGGLDGVVEFEWMYGVSGGLSKKFLNDRAKISFGVDNLFTRFYYGSILYDNLDMTINSKWDVPVFNLQFSYNFGNKHLSKQQNHQSSADDELNRADKN